MNKENNLIEDALRKILEIEREHAYGERNGPVSGRRSDIERAISSLYQADSKNRKEPQS
jgi:hypothetical protein